MRSEPGLARAIIRTALAKSAAGGGLDAGPSAVDVGHRLVLDVLSAAAVEQPRTSLDDLAHLVLVAIDGITVVHLIDDDVERAERNLRHLTAALGSLC